MKKSEIWSIPNLISYARIALMPVYVNVTVNATTREDYFFSSFLLLFLAFTDALDGYIARKFNMITELGKLIDPVADKLFQLAICLTLIHRIKGMWVVFIVFFVKELILMIQTWYFYTKYKRKMDGAMWCGKFSTAVFYLLTFLMAILPPLPTIVYYVMEGCIIFALVLASVVYSQFFLDLYRRIKK